jgi:hypothetical protein
VTRLELSDCCATVSRRGYTRDTGRHDVSHHSHTVPPAPAFEDGEDDGDELPEALRPLADRTVTVIDLARDLLGAIEDGDAGQIRRAQRALLEGVALIDEAMLP